MRNKFVYTAAILFAVAAFPALAQEEEAIDAPFMATAFPPNLLLQNPGRSSLLTGVQSIMLQDGTRLSQRDALAALAATPGNERLVAQVRSGRTWSGILCGDTIAASTTLAVFWAADLPGASDIVLPITLLVNSASLAGIVLINGVTDKRFLMAVDNYNLYVLGIPVAGRN